MGRWGDGGAEPSPAVPIRADPCRVEPDPCRVEPIHADSRGAAAVGADAARGGSGAIKAAAAAAAGRHAPWRAAALALCAWRRALLSARGHGIGPAAPRRRSWDKPGGGGAPGRRSWCIEALQEVLEKLKSKRGPHYERSSGRCPWCSVAVRKGARIGKLCDCPRGTSCNSFLLKCL
uniref:Cocaine- and amphetamine-regulated transcript protein n=1 Tax=Malurus cyaneus samueli TaxID=2593467 RepID=A0A8C5TD98_9PASS